MSRVIHQIQEFLAQHPVQGRGVVAVSGGADSVALLRGLHRLRVPLVVAHLDHQLRGTESTEDALFVQQLAEELYLPMERHQEPIAEYAAMHKLNLEEAARLRRYAFLEQVAIRHQATWFATGHTANDQAETVLHRLIRGTGLPGLRGIAPIRQNGSIQVIRPLLTVSRSEIIQFLDELGQPFRTDSTNADLVFTRNRLRAEVLPLLTSFNPEIVTALGRLATQAEECQAYVTGQVRALLQQVERPRVGGTVILDCTQFQQQPRYLIGELLRQLWEREGWPRRGMTQQHWHRLVAIAYGELSRADFPEGMRAQRVGRVLQLERFSGTRPATVSADPPESVS